MYILSQISGVQEQPVSNIDFTTVNLVLNLLKQGKSERDIFIENSISTNVSRAIINDVNRLEQDTLTLISSNLIPDTKDSLVNLLTEEIIPVAIIVDEMIKCFPDYNPDRTYSQFRILSANFSYQ